MNFKVSQCYSQANGIEYTVRSEHGMLTIISMFFQITNFDGDDFRNKIKQYNGYIDGECVYFKTYKDCKKFIVEYIEQLYFMQFLAYGGCDLQGLF